MNPYFSIIVSVYNAEAYLREFLDSIIGQTFTDWECICINDGSKDGSKMILDEYAAKDTRIKPIHKANEGVGKARNVGLDVAIGKWITWADADDILAPSRLEAARRILEKEDPDLLQMHFVMAKDMPDGFMDTGAESEYKVICGAAESFAYAWSEIRPLAILWLTFARRQLYEGLKYPEDMRVKGDGILCADLYPRLKKICHSKHTGYFYRMTPVSIFRSERKAIDCVRMQRALLEQYKRQEYYALSLGRLSCEVLSSSIRNVSESDVIDWLLGRGQRNEIDAKVVRESYDAIRFSGAYCASTSLPLKHRLGFYIYTRYRSDVVLRLVERCLRVYRRATRSL